MCVCVRVFQAPRCVRGQGSPVPSVPAPGGHEGLTPISGVSGELEREIKEGSFARPVLGMSSSDRVCTGSGVGLKGGKKQYQTIRRTSEYM